MTDANAMFCFQCEQTIGCSGCTGAAGACGKQASTAQVQDELTGALVGLARTVRAAGVTGDARRAADDLVMEGLFATLTNVDFDDAELESLVRLARAQKALGRPLRHARSATGRYAAYAPSSGFPF
mgnify:CR=1 FL=1